MIDSWGFYANFLLIKALTVSMREKLNPSMEFVGMICATEQNPTSYNLNRNQKIWLDKPIKVTLAHLVEYLCKHI